MRDFARSFYKSQAWKRLRNDIMKRDGGICRDCWDKGMLTPAEEVHHIIPLTPENISDPDIALNPANLVCLCRDCHAARHRKNPRRYQIDENGAVKPR